VRKNGQDCDAHRLILGAGLARFMVEPEAKAQRQQSTTACDYTTMVEAERDRQKPRNSEALRRVMNHTCHVHMLACARHYHEEES